MGRPRKNSLPAPKKEQEKKVIENKVIDISDVKIIDSVNFGATDKKDIKPVPVDGEPLNNVEVDVIEEVSVKEDNTFPAIYGIENKTNGQIIIPFLGVNLRPGEKIEKSLTDSKKHSRLINICKQLADIYGGEILVTRAE